MKSNKGMTLVELVVSLAIAAIILVSIAGILFVSFRTFYDISDSTQDKIIGDTVYDLLFKKITIAQNVNIQNNHSIVINNTDTIYVNEEGLLFYNNTQYYGEEFYHNRTLSINIEKYSSDMVSVDINVYNNNKLSYSTGSVFKMLNFKFPDVSVIVQRKRAI